MIAIVAATKDEVSSLLKKISGREITSVNSTEFINGNLLETPLIVAISGVGIKRTRSCINTLIQKFEPNIIVSAGFAGALNPRLNVGDLVIPDWVTSLKAKRRIHLENKLPYLAFNFTNGGLLTENSFINTREKKLDLFIASSADIVDMETWAIAEIAQKKHVQLLSVRVVSDHTGSQLPRMEMIYGNDSKLDFYKSIKYFKSNPSQFFNYIKFRFIDMRKARIRLNSFLELLVPLLSKMGY